MKVYALQLNQNSNADVFHAILPNFRIILGGCFLHSYKKTEEEKDSQWPYGFTLSLSPEQLFISHETIFFLHKVSQFGLWYPFLRKGLAA